jgi:RNA polymerase sigma-70 factor (ECF subfamily)
MPKLRGLVLGFPEAPMARLADAFVAARARSEPGTALAVAPSVPETEAGSLETALAALLAAGAAAHPDLSLDGVLFAAHLGRCGAPVDGENRTPVRAEDLYLAAAALQGDEVAVAKLRRIHRPVLAGYLRTMTSSSAFLDEVEQRLWEMALVGTNPKLATYSGQGALAGWVGIAAHRIALMIHRHEAIEERAADAAAAEAELDAVAADPELAFIKGKLREKFGTALGTALTSLEDRERMIYKMHILDGLTVEAVAKVYGVSHSTVSRWLAKAREEVIRETKRLLRTDTQLSPAEFESLAGLVVSQLDLSVSRLLRTAP